MAKKKKTVSKPAKKIKKSKKPDKGGVTTQDATNPTDPPKPKP